MITRFTTKVLRNSHGPQKYQEPYGFLFNEIKRKREPWELPFYVTVGSIVIFVIAWNFKPDTSLITWAELRAKERLIEGGYINDKDIARIGNK